jgi:integrase
VARNPVEFVRPPRPEVKEMAVLTEDETAALVEAVRGHWLYLPVLLAVTTGMRRGELLALRWADVDVDAGTCVVRQSVQQVKGGRAGLTFKGPKTAKSRRSVALPALAVEALIRHKAEQAALRLRLGPAYRNQDLVVARDDGSPVVPNAVTKAFINIQVKHGLRRVRFHDLRHSHATHLLRAAVNIKVVSERLGHARSGITLDIYSHVMPGMQEDAAQRVDGALRAAFENRTREGTG